MIAVSFFTANGKYPALAKRLADSCKRFDIRSNIAEFPDHGNWHKTINAKPGFILGNLLNWRCPVLWLDCDCEILKMPSLLWQGGSDFAIYNWRADSENVRGVPYDPLQLTSSGGVSWWDYTAPTIELLVRWQMACHQNPDGVDDQTLDVVFQAHRPPVRPRWLSKQMNWMTGMFGPAGDDVIIRHDFVNGKHRNDAEGSA